MRTTPLLLGLCLMAISASETSAQIQLYNDEFDQAATLDANWLNLNEVEGWQAEHLEIHDINTSTSSSLHMMPWTSSWYENYKGTLIHKNIDQDFVITTSVVATNRGGTDIPGSLYSLAGIMIRTPRDYPNGALIDWTPGGENYIFLSAGYAAGGNGPHLEVKTTTNSNSNLQVTPISSAINVEIRVARIDNAIITLYRLDGQNWTVHNRYTRNDFPSELQVGFVTYTDWTKVSSYDPFFHNSHVLNSDLNPDPTPGVPFDPDLIGQFEFARFDDVEVPVALLGVDLVNVASDADILSFLGYDSEEYCPDIQYVYDVIQNGQIAEMHVAIDLEAENIISPDAIVQYTAGNSIDLLEDFEVALGADFEASITGCP